MERHIAGASTAEDGSVVIRRIEDTKTTFTGFEAPPRLLRILNVLIAIGAITLAMGMFLAPARIWPNLLLVSYYLLGLSLAAIFFVALKYTVGATWNIAFRRIPEAMSTILPIGVLLLAVVLIAKPSLYSWTTDLHLATPESAFKHVWLNRPFFLVRSAIYVLLWVIFTRAIVNNSRRQDINGDMSYTRKNVRLSAGFLVVFSLTFWLASYDWIMSLEPEWYSTIFGVYNFAGLFVSGLAGIIILTVWLKKLGPLQHVLTEEHLHDLGKLLFAFSTFWMYIWFSQYLLIWYANFPEETSHYIFRLRGNWEPLFFLNIILNWAIPFFVLLPSGTKRRASTLVRVSLVILLGRWLDLYLQILPPSAGDQPIIGIWEIGLILGAVGIFLSAFFRVLKKAPLIPSKDPFLSESLNYHR